MSELILLRPRDEILKGRLARPAGRGRFQPKRPATTKSKSVGHKGIMITGGPPLVLGQFGPYGRIRFHPPRPRDRRGMRPPSGGWSSGGAGTGPAVAPMDFYSWWAETTGYAVGSPDTAVKDGNGGTRPYNWNANPGSGYGDNRCEVIANPGGFGPSNVMRVRALVASSGFSFIRHTGLGTPGPNDKWYYRMEFSVTYPDGGTAQENHPIQCGAAASDSDWQWNVFSDGFADSLGNTPAAGHFGLEMWFKTTENPGNNDRWVLTTHLSKNHVYRVEWMVETINSSDFHFNIRIYDAWDSTTVLFGNSSFQRWISGGTLADNPTLHYHDVADMDGWSVGSGGHSGSVDMLFMDQAACAFRKNADWIGPYSATAEPRRA